jgi:hypothetical protein
MPAAGTRRPSAVALLAVLAVPWVVARVIPARTAAAVATPATTASATTPAAPATAPVTERVAVSADGRGFVLTPSGRPFVPLGLNYGNAGRLIEDYWDADWPTVERDWADMRAMGANLVRVHLQFGKFMAAADKPNARALDQLANLLTLSERTGLYLDLTGLACYRKADVPAWYDALDEPGRWAAQSAFWSAVAGRCAASPAVFCYDLMNEPIIPGDKKPPGQWYSGSNLGGYDFIQFPTLDPAGRKRDAVARDWIRTLKAAIRERDPKTPVTVGLLPWGPKWGHLSGFVPETVAPDLDYVSVHIYPEKGKVPEAIEGLKKFAVGKPVVIEETFPLACGVDELAAFLREAKPIAAGVVGHYDGLTVEGYGRLKAEGKLTVAQGMWREWLVLFRKLAAGS